MNDDKCLQLERNGRTAKLRLMDWSHRNAMSTEMFDAFADAATSLRRDSSVDTVIVCGHANFFSAGANREDIVTGSYNNLRLPDRTRLLRRAAEAMRAWETVPQVTIAAIEGYAVGAGVTLALTCDFRVCGKSAYFYGPEVDLGFSFGLNTIPRLTALIGPAKTKAFIMFCEKWYAPNLLSIGLIDYMVEDGEAEQLAETLSNTLNMKPQSGIYYTKLAVNETVNALAQVSSFADADQILLCMQNMKNNGQSA